MKTIGRVIIQVSLLSLFAMGLSVHTLGNEVVKQNIRIAASALGHLSLRLHIEGCRDMQGKRYHWGVSHWAEDMTGELSLYVCHRVILSDGKIRYRWTLV